MRVALYARCSTADQSVDLQLDGLRDYAKARGFTVVEEYLDEAVSGAKARRSPQAHKIPTTCLELAAKRTAN